MTKKYFCRSASDKDMPVIFLPNEEEEDCGDSNDTQMSAFGFMSFAMALVNVVINNANNVNNNNNNNNNNDNNNNNNLGNINIANSNNDVNNMNMVTAGRRRRLYRNVSDDHQNSILSDHMGLIDKMTNKQQNRYEMLISDREWKTDTISIGYITNHTNPHNVTKEKEPAKLYPPHNGFPAKFKMVHDHVFQKTKYINSIIINSIAKIPFKTYFPTFSLAKLWSGITSIIGKRRRKR